MTTTASPAAAGTQEINQRSNAKPGHSWTFFRAGGVDQVVLRSGEDLANLGSLDQKLWMVLAMPVSGVDFDPKTAQLLDIDKDGRIRPPELLAAVRWADATFKDLGDLMKGGSSVALAAIKDSDIRSAAKQVLKDLGKADAGEIKLDDVDAHAKVLAKNKLNGDGVVTVDLAGDETARKALEDVLRTMGGVEDRSGKSGVNQAMVDGLFSQAHDLLKWADAAQADKTRTPLGLEATLAALAAVKAMKGKVDDYFARCRLAAFDERAVAALNREEKEYLALTAKDLTITSQEIACLPLARIAPAQPLPLSGAVNPAWAAALAAMAAKAIEPLLGSGKTTLSEEDWTALLAKMAPFEAWLASKPATRVESLGFSPVCANWQRVPRKRPSTN